MSLSRLSRQSHLLSQVDKEQKNRSFKEILEELRFYSHFEASFNTQQYDIKRFLNIKSLRKFEIDIISELVLAVLMGFRTNRKKIMDSPFLVYDKNFEYVYVGKHGVEYNIKIITNKTDRIVLFISYTNCPDPKLNNQFIDTIMSVFKKKYPQFEEEVSEGYYLDDAPVDKSGDLSDEDFKRS